MKRLIPYLVIFCSTPLFADAAGGPHNPEFEIKRLIGFIGIILFIIMIKTGWMALALLVSLFRTRSLVEYSGILNRGLAKSFLIGLLLLAFYAFMFIILSRYVHRPFDLILSIPVFLVLITQLLMAFTAVSHYLGEKIQMNTGGNFKGSSFIAVLYGGTVIMLCSFFPLLGQITELGVLIIGLGANFQHLMRRFSRKQ